MNGYEYSSFRVWVISWIDVATGIPKKYIGVDMGEGSHISPNILFGANVFDKSTPVHSG